MGHWHGLVKLCLHTDSTLEILDHNTTLLGQLLRDFQLKTCTAFDTKELPREADARDRRKAKTKAVAQLSTEIPTTQDVPTELPAVASSSASLLGTPRLQYAMLLLIFYCRYRASTTTHGETAKKTTKEACWFVCVTLQSIVYSHHPVTQQLQRKRSQTKTLKSPQSGATRQ